MRETCLVPVTSRLASADFGLADWQAAGLNVPSAVKSQIATVDGGLVRKVVGRLGATDAATLTNHLRQWLGL